MHCIQQEHIFIFFIFFKLILNYLAHLPPYALFQFWHTKYQKRLHHTNSAWVSYPYPKNWKNRSRAVLRWKFKHDLVRLSVVWTVKQCSHPKT